VARSFRRRAVDGVGLGELANRLGEVPDLARVDDGKRQAGAGQRRRHCRFEAAGGFESGQRKMSAFQGVRRGPPSLFHREGFSRWPQGHIEPSLGHIDADGICDAARLVHDPSGLACGLNFVGFEPTGK
jgi:hypothetical protein